MLPALFCIQCFAEAYAIMHCHLNGVPFTPLIGVILEFVSCHCLLLGDMVSLRLPIRTMLSCSDGVGTAKCFALSRLMPSQSTRKHSSPMTAMRENVATCVSVSSKNKFQCQCSNLGAESACSLSCPTMHLRCCSRKHLPRPRCGDSLRSGGGHRERPQF